VGSIHVLFTIPYAGITLIKYINSLFLEQLLTGYNLSPSGTIQEEHPFKGTKTNHYF
jgi:hypothetical protein